MTLEATQKQNAENIQKAITGLNAHHNDETLIKQLAEIISTHSIGILKEKLKNQTNFSRTENNPLTIVYFKQVFSSYLNKIVEICNNALERQHESSVSTIKEYFKELNYADNTKEFYTKVAQSVQIKLNKETAADPAWTFKIDLINLELLTQTDKWIIITTTTETKIKDLFNVVFYKSNTKDGNIHTRSTSVGSLKNGVLYNDLYFGAECQVYRGSI